MVNKAKSFSEISGYEFLRDAFKEEQKLLQTKLDFAKKTITHDCVAGSIGEIYWIEVLRKYLPHRYAVDSAIIIDSNGKTSDQIDIVIYDPQYTPSLLTQESHRYIPIEAVYAVLEAKPTINKEYLKYAGDKAASVRKLQRTSVSIAHAGGTYFPKSLFSICAGIVSVEAEWKDGLGDTFIEIIKEQSKNPDVKIDCVCALHYGTSFFIDGKTDENIVVLPENSLIYFIFRLLKMLQSLGTVPAIDWGKYAVCMLECK